MDDVDELTHYIGEEGNAKDHYAHIKDLLYIRHWIQITISYYGKSSDDKVAAAYEPVEIIRHLIEFEASYKVDTLQLVPFALQMIADDEPHAAQEVNDSNGGHDEV